MEKASQPKTSMLTFAYWNSIITLYIDKWVLSSENGIKNL